MATQTCRFCKLPVNPVRGAGVGATHEGACPEPDIHERAWHKGFLGLAKEIADLRRSESALRESLLPLSIKVHFDYASWVRYSSLKAEKPFWKRFFYSAVCEDIDNLMRLFAIERTEPGLPDVVTDGVELEIQILKKI